MQVTLILGTVATLECSEGGVTEIFRCGYAPYSTCADRWDQFEALLSLPSNGSNITLTDTIRSAALYSARLLLRVTPPW